MFEASWTIKGKNFIRYRDKDKSKKISTSYKTEFFVPDKLGQYTGFLDGVKLRKQQGRPDNNAYGIKKSEYVAIREQGKIFNKSPRTWFLDIETSVGTKSEGFPKPEEALEPIVLIQFFDTQEDKGYVLGLEDWYYRDDYTYDFNLEYIKLDTEKELLGKFIELFQTLDPLIITAWNANNFDFPYLYNRLEKFNLNKLSNYGNVKLNTKKLDNNQIVNNLNSDGHYFLDLLDVYKKFVYKNVSSYSLDNIGEIETGINKVEHKNYLKFDDFRTGKYVILGDETKEKETKIYKCAYALENNKLTEIQKNKLKKYIKEKSYSEFVHYGVQDFVILKGINDSQNLISIMIEIAEKMGCTIGDTLGTLKPWNNYIANIAYKDKKIMPPKEKHDEPDIVGGFVREPKVGKHNWIMSADVNSMYPLLSIAAGNMSPETFVPVALRPKELQAMITKYFPNQDESRYLKYTKEWDTIENILKKYDVSLGINGAVYSRDKMGLIPKLVVEIYNSRKQKKKQMFIHKQNAVNIEHKLKENPTKELLKEYKKEKHLESMMDTAQMTEKILINSLYGAIGNAYFALFNEQIAQSITGNGRYFIQFVANKVEEKLQKMIPFKKYIIAGDTDSVVGSSVIKTSLGDIKIEDLYNVLNGQVDIINKNNFVKHVTGIEAASLNDNIIVENKKIKYIMKHKVKKRMFKITHNNDTVIITEDHSIMILRNNKLISVKPKDIQPSDKIIKL